MSSRHRTVLVLLLPVVLHLACSESQGRPKQITELPRVLTASETTVIAGSNAFGFELFREVDTRRELPNTILSPLSASMALGMALAGAEGDTFSEMQLALGFQGVSREEINASFSGLFDLLVGLDPAVEVGISNSAWNRQGYPFEESYVDIVADTFRAIVQELDFGDPNAKNIINQWVREQTDSRIEGIVDIIAPETIFFLINAVYFNGDWTTSFKQQQTRSVPFNLEDNSVVDVQMMADSIEHVGYARGDRGRVVAELPYGGQAFGMVLVLPGDDETLEDLVIALDEEVWNTWMAGLQLREVSVMMPKVELEWQGPLREALEVMGMERAFGQQADFSRMTVVPGFRLTKVLQKAYLKIDEEGTEAVAATSVEGGPISAPPGITIDRPYLLAIRERLSGTILFLGAIRDPR